MICFRVSFEPGVPIYEQVVYAAKKAILSGALPPGERFPSVRALSQEFKINPNTAHKVVGELIAERLLEVLPGLGTVVSKRPGFTEADRARLLKTQVEQLVVEAKTIGIELEKLLDSIRSHWVRLDSSEAPTKARRL